MFDFDKPTQRRQKDATAADAVDNRPSLQTVRLQLRPFDENDSDRFGALIDDQEIAINTRTLQYPLPSGSAATWIDAHLALWLSGQSVIFAICLLDQPEMIGAIGLEIAIDDHRGELGYWLGRSYWRQGFASEAAKAVVDYGLEQMALNKICAHCIASNHASQRVLEKVGFRQEGYLRKHVRHWGRYHDLVCWGILHEER